MVITADSRSGAENGSLAAAIGQAGRRATPRSLTLVVLSAGAVLAAILWLWHGHGIYAVPFVMPIAFGAWGLAVHGERALAGDPETRVERALLRALRGLMVLVGAAAATVTIFGITFALSGSGPLQLR